MFIATDSSQFLYTAFNKPSRVTRGGQWIDLVYDADRQRIVKHSSTVTVQSAASFT